MTQTLKETKIGVVNGFDIYHVQMFPSKDVVWLGYLQSNTDVRASFSEYEDLVKYCKRHTAVIQLVHKN